MVGAHWSKLWLYTENLAKLRVGALSQDYSTDSSRKFCWGFWIWQFGDLGQNRQNKISANLLFMLSASCLAILYAHAHYSLAKTMLLSGTCQEKMNLSQRHLQLPCFSRKVSTQSKWSDKSLLLRTKHNSCYCYHIPILGVIFFSCSLVVQVQHSYQIWWAWMQHSTLYTSIVLLEVTLIMWDNTRYRYMGCLCQVTAWKKIEFRQPPFFWWFCPI